MTDQQLIGFAIVALMAVWILMDARRLSTSRGTQVGGHNPLSWAIATILLPIVAVPVYLVSRYRFLGRTAHLRA